MKSVRAKRWIALAAVLTTACGRPSDPTVRSPIPEPEATADPAIGEALLELDRRATAAWFEGDAAFLDGVLGDRFVLLAPGGPRLDREATTRRAAGQRCELAPGWTLDEPRLSKVDADTYVLTYRGTFDGTCTFDGGSGRIPSPVRAATVWVRSGESWRAAFHGVNRIFDPEAAEAPSAETASGAPAPPAGEPAAPEAGSAAPAAEPITRALMAIEASVWEAWKDRDGETLEERTASDLAFVDIFGNVTSGKAKTLDFWTRHACEVRGVRVADGTGTELSPTVGLLAFEGTVEGTCGGQAVPPILGTSVYVREGGAWKLAFTLNHLPD